MSEEDDIVDSLVKRSFSSRSMAEKKYIIERGRSTPDLKTREGMRNFRPQWYEDIEWLCGSKVTKSLYCWPCLLFNPKERHRWTSTGYKSLKNLTSDAKDHGQRLVHLASLKKLKTFGLYNISTAISHSEKTNQQLHNKKVDENRAYLQKLVDAVLYLSKQEMPLRGHDESQNSLNKGNYRELLQVFAKNDSVFAARLNSREGSNHFSGVSSTIQNDIITAIANVIKEQIKKEIADAPFVAVQADETTDCATHAQLSVIVRYVLEDKIYERFLGFYEVSENKNAESLSNIITAVLDSYGVDKVKLVCQTYDGAAVMAGKLSGVQRRLKENGYNNAKFIHCYAHRLNLVLSRSAEKVNGVRIFFSHVRLFSKFTSSSTARKTVFRNFGINIPSLCETRWCYRTRTIAAIKTLRFKIKDALNSIVDSPSKWDDDTLCQADHLLSKLNDFKFMFLINSFHKILSQAGTLFDILQCRQLDIKFGNQKVSEFINCIEQYKTEDQFDSIVDETSQSVSDVDGESRVRGAPMNFKNTYFEIMESMLSSLQERFANRNDFLFFELFNVTNFTDYSKRFPRNLIDLLDEKYPNFFDTKCLTNELKYFYIDEDFKKCSSLNSMLSILFEYKLTSGMPEITKLLQLLLTIPLTSVSSERSFSTLNRIRSYLRTTMTQDRLSSLALISIEKRIINIMEEDRELFEKVLQEFAIKKRRLEFVYK